MAGARPGYGAKPGAAAPPKKVDPKLKMYNLIRWMCYLLFPIAGLVLICVGIGMAMAIDTKDAYKNMIIPLLVMIGGTLLAYVSIYYNKR